MRIEALQREIGVLDGESQEPQPGAGSWPVCIMIPVSDGKPG